MRKNWKFERFRLLAAIVLLSLFQSWVCCLNEEGLALLTFKDGVINDPFGALSNWRDEDGEIDHCSWLGVECADGKVVILNLKDLCLEGSLAPELGTLVHIKSIVLRNNSFSGTIPQEIGAMKELEVLDLGYNNFSGPLPPDLGNNLSLTVLFLEHNQLLGGMSAEIFELQRASEAQTHYNQPLSSVKSSCYLRTVPQNKYDVQRRLLRAATSVTGPPKSPQPKPSPISYMGSPMGHFFNPPNETHSAPKPPPASSAKPSKIRNNTSPVSDAVAPSPSPSVKVPSPSESNARLYRRSHSGSLIAILAGSIGGAVLLVMSVLLIYLCKSNKVSTVKPWATGLSGQLQKAFVTGVPNLKRSELEAACEDFSNVIGSSPIGTVFKGTLSSGVEIAVASVDVTSKKDWSKNLETQFRKKIETLSKVNHKNFVNLLGYCEEDEQPFTRMMVFEYAPNGCLFEHLHIKESEHLDWVMRLRIAMGIAYCLEHMHQLKHPVAHNNLSSSSVSLTEDYAAKVSDLSFGNQIAAARREATRNKLSGMPPATPGSNIYNFGVLLFEMVTGRLPYSVQSDHLEDWASDYLSLRNDRPLRDIVDPTLNSFDENQLDKIVKIISSCVDPDPRQRPGISQVVGSLREVTGITPGGAVPKLSPLWWAELEVLSTVQQSCSELFGASTG